MNVFCKKLLTVRCQDSHFNPSERHAGTYKHANYFVFADLLELIKGLIIVVQSPSIAFWLWGWVPFPSQGGSQNNQFSKTSTHSQRPHSCRICRVGLLSNFILSNQFIYLGLAQGTFVCLTVQYLNCDDTDKAIEVYWNIFFWEDYDDDCFYYYK